MNPLGVAYMLMFLISRCSLRRSISWLAGYIKFTLSPKSYQQLRLIKLNISYWQSCKTYTRTWESDETHAISLSHCLIKYLTTSLTSSCHYMTTPFSRQTTFSLPRSSSTWWCDTTWGGPGSHSATHHISFCFIKQRIELCNYGTCIC